MFADPNAQYIFLSVQVDSENHVGCFIDNLSVLFDLEVAFLVPWASIFKEIGHTDSLKWFGFIEMLVFLVILTVGYVYAWAKGALDWE